MTIENNEVLNDSPETIETQEEVVVETQEETTDEPQETQVEQKPTETPEAKIARLKRQLEREEKKLGIVKPEPTKVVAKPKQEATLSQTDLYSLMRANVAEEDIQEVSDYARLKGMTVSEALKTPLVKSLLSEKEEMRKTALATHTGTPKRGSSKPTDEQLLSKVSKGELPENEDDLAKLYRLRKGIKN